MNNIVKVGRIVVLRTDKVLFPHGEISIPFPTSGADGAAAWEDFKDPEQGKRLVLVVAKKPSGEDETYNVGTLALASFTPGAGKNRQPTLTLRGLTRAKVGKPSLDLAGHLTAEIDKLEPERDASTPRTEHLLDTLTRRVTEYMDRRPVLKAHIPFLDREQDRFLESLDDSDTPGQALGTVASLLARKNYLPTPALQKALEINSIPHQIAVLGRLMEDEIRNLSKYTIAPDKAHLYSTLYAERQREFEEMAENRKNNASDEDDNMKELADKIKDAPLPPDVRAKLEKGLERLQNMPPSSSEADVQRTWIETVAELPWGKKDKTNDDIRHAAEVLDSDHYGLDKVKKKVLQHLSVQKRQGGAGKSPILLLVGPPGVGKTSIARSIAKATGQKYARMALGGMREESELRGHRRTFVGAMPGQIIKLLKKAGTDNPVFVLDEVDKLSADARSNPAHALLEILDPEQNKAFKDHYLDMDYDLSNITFIATANSLKTIPRPLLDRMEVVQVSGYTPDQKLEIARRHLVGQALSETGLTAQELKIDTPVIEKLISDYTNESGVRGLKRQLVGLGRAAAYKIETEGVQSVHITLDNLAEYAGKSRVTHDKIAPAPEVGAVNGLAYTPTGGVILPLEAVVDYYPAKDLSVVATGNLGKVMKESIPVATGYITSHAAELGLQEKDLHKMLRVHAPDAVPKDGPSAGAAFTTVMLSALKGLPIRNDVAMTGEVTMHGKVLPIGGVPEKLTGAFNAGVKKVLLPEKNYLRDLDDVPEKVRAGLEIVPVTTLRDVFRHAFVNGDRYFPAGSNDNEKSQALSPEPETRAARKAAPAPKKGKRQPG